MALNAYRGLPLAFVRNAGQLDRRVRYSARAGSVSVFLTHLEAVVALGQGRRGLALRLAFLGASPAAAITGARRSPGGVNYLVGNDPARWQTNLPTYEEVVYRNLWPGIDMAVRGRGGQLKYEFRLAPRADPARIRLAYRGQERLSLEQDGALRIETGLGYLRDTRPASYQLVNDKRVAVASRFALGQRGVYGFALGSYDRRYPLVIDPGLIYSTYLGGSSSSVANDDYSGEITVDGAGNAYVTGEAESHFPTTPVAFDRSFSGGDFDTFVTKLNRAGSALVYSTYLGGSSIDSGSAIAVDADGSAYVTGLTSSADFPTTAGAFDSSLNDSTGDAYVTKLDAAGSALTYSTYLGGSGVELGGHGIAVDGAGSAYVTGHTSSVDFPTTPGAFDRGFDGLGDAFVTKLNAGGSALAYSTFLGGSRAESGAEIAVDVTGSAYVTGSTQSTNFPATASAFDTSFGGRADVFVTKLNALGSALDYSTYLGGRDIDGGGGIAVDGAGNAYVTGDAYRSFPTTVAAFDRSFNGGRYDAFVTKLNAGGSALAYSTYLGGASDEGGRGIAVDGAGSAYVTGSTESNYFPTTSGAFDRSINDRDAFVTKLNRAGSRLAYSTFLGGTEDERHSSIAVDGDGFAYVAGTTESRNFPTTAGSLDRSFGIFIDAFVTKLELIAGTVRCWVPRVNGMTLAKAKRTIRALDCSVGGIRRVRSTRVGRVVAQSPRAGAVRRRGFKVTLIVGRR